MFYTYVLKSKKNNKLYTGSTRNLKRRLAEHQSGKSTYTKDRGPFVLLYYEAGLNKEDARLREVYLKSGMGKRYLKNRLKYFFLDKE
jgi:putative endonuclease